jgi:hypothetical protein
MSITRRSTTAASAEESPNGNGQPESPNPPPAPAAATPSSLPIPKAGTNVSVDARLRYDTTAEQVAPATPAKPAAVPLNSLPSAKPNRRYTQLDEWLAYWKDYEQTTEYEDVSRFRMSVTREPDGFQSPNTVNLFRVPCVSDRFLFQHPFTTDPNQFAQHLQSLEGSGGNFRVVLLDADGDPVSSWVDPRTNQPNEPNYMWRGQITNPPLPQGQNPNRQPAPAKDKSVTDFLKELIEQKTLMQQAGLIKEEKSESGNSMLSQLDASAAAAVITTMGNTLTSVNEAASKFKDTDKGLGRTLVENVLLDDTIKGRLVGALDTGLSLIATVIEKGLENKQRRWEIEHAKKNGQPPPDEKPRETGIDIAEYLLGKCERKETLNFLEDEQIKAWGNNNKLALIRVKGLLRDETPEKILETFVERCEKAGKGEKARAVAGMAHARQWVERLQATLNPQPEE